MHIQSSIHRFAVRWRSFVGAFVFLNSSRSICSSKPGVGKKKIRHDTHSSLFACAFAFCFLLFSRKTEIIASMVLLTVFLGDGHGDDDERRGVLQEQIDLRTG